MKKFLIVYISLTGHTKKMAEFVAEGIRMSGGEAVIKALPQLKTKEDFLGYDGYLFASPTFHKDMALGFKNWLFKAKNVGLEGKFGGAFGSHTHSGEAPGLLHATMEHVLKMNMVGLGPLSMMEREVGTADGMHTCQQFGKAVGERSSQG